MCVSYAAPRTDHLDKVNPRYPLTGGGAAQSAVDGLLCVQYDNSASKGEFFEVSWVVHVPVSRKRMLGITFYTYDERARKRSKRQGRRTTRQSARGCCWYLPFSLCHTAFSFPYLCPSTPEPHGTQDPGTLPISIFGDSGASEFSYHDNLAVPVARGTTETDAFFDKG